MQNRSGIWVNKENNSKREKGEKVKRERRKKQATVQILIAILFILEKVIQTVYAKFSFLNCKNNNIF